MTFGQSKSNVWSLNLLFNQMLKNSMVSKIYKCKIHSWSYSLMSVGVGTLITIKPVMYDDNVYGISPAFGSDVTLAHMAWRYMLQRKHGTSVDFMWCQYRSAGEMP